MKRRLALLFAALLLVITTHASGGNSFGELVTRLQRGADFRLRGQAALDLGKSQDPRARGPLEGALDDKSASVRAAAAAALKNLRDKRALAALKEHRLDRSSAVRGQINAAISTLEAIPDPKVVVQIGDMRNGTTIKAPSAVVQLRELSRRKLAQIPELAVSDGPADSTLQLPVVKLTGSIRSLTAAKEGNGIVYSAQVEYVLHRMPGESIAGRVSGSARAEATAGDTKDNRSRAALRAQVLDAAVDSAVRRASQALLVVASR
jgi:hypothetical protein